MNKPSAKIGIIIGVIVLILAVVVVVVIIGSKPHKTTEEKAVEKTQKIVNELESRSNEEKDSEDETIKNVEAIIEAQLTGTNNQGKPYKRFVLVERRYTQEEKLLVTVRFNADENPLTEREQVKKKMAEILKAIYSTDYSFGFSIIEAYTSKNDTLPVYAVRLDESDTNQVDWSQGVDKLYKDILPSIWRVTDDRFNDTNNN